MDARYTRCRKCWREKVAAEGAKPAHDFSQVPTVPGDCMVVSDVHVPHHDPHLLDQLVGVAQAHGIRRLVVGGDFLDWPEISRYPKEHHGGNAVTALQGAVRVLAVLAEQFTGGIWAIKGNHELRAERLIAAAVEGRGFLAAVLADFEQDDVEALDFRSRYVNILDRWTRKIAPAAAGVIHWRPEAEILIAGPHGEKPWRVVHQRNGSRRPPYEALNHWQRWTQPIICTHTHLHGYAIAPDGRTPIVQLGMATREEWHAYAWKEPTGYPRWVQCFGMIRGGRLTLYPGTPYMGLPDAPATAASR